MRRRRRYALQSLCALLLHDSAASETDVFSITLPAAKILWSTLTICSQTKSKSIKSSKRSFALHILYSL